jgi:uncharacterized alkaline shock family protein YloU
VVAYGLNLAEVAATVRSRVGYEVERLTGLRVANVDGAVALELHVVVAYGLNLAEVAATVRSQVGYEVERLTGLPVASVDVHIQDVKRTA